MKEVLAQVKIPWPQGDVIEKLHKISTSFEGIYSLLEKREKRKGETIYNLGCYQEDPVVGRTYSLQSS